MALTGIKFRAYPTREQKRRLSQWMGCARFIYNAKCDDDKYYRTFLAHSLGLTGEQVPVDQSYSQYKSEITPWLKDCPSPILRNSAVILYQAYQKYFQGLAGRPKRKKKAGKDSIWLTNEVFRFDEGKLFIGQRNNNIGYLSFEAHREFEIPKSISLSRKNGQWFISFCYDDGRPSPNPIEKLKELSQLNDTRLLSITDGADRGIKIPLQTASGTSFDFTPAQKASLAQQQKRIGRQQKKLAGQQKGSRRREQTKQRIARAHNKIANIRKDFVHQTSRKLADSNSEIFIFEDLKTKNMSTAPKPKQDGNGRYLPNASKAKAGLNAAILHSAWGIIVLYTAYKAVRQNKIVIKLPPQHSSQECHHCGYIHPHNWQTQANFVCLSCGHAENADLNAAKVLQKRGVKAILSTLEWHLNTDQTLVAKSHTRGTRGSARGGNHKTQQTVAQSQRSANLVVVAHST